MNMITDITDKPQIIDKVHESCYRTYHILNYVMIMLSRGDSKETIKEVVDFCKHYPLNANRIIDKPI
jgi:hypothetical protein